MTDDIKKDIKDEGGQQQSQQPVQQGNQQTQPIQIDYDKIQQMLNGTLEAKQDTALKAYFKQQGLSEGEMTKAISQFKAQKASQEPDVGALQTQLTQAQQEAAQASKPTHRQPH